MVQIKRYIASVAATAVIAGCGNPDPKIAEYGLKTIGMVKVYPDNDCISFLYDLDGDNNIDILEYRRWNEQGKISRPIRVFYDRDGDMKISNDEISEWKDPLPDAPPCPPDRDDVPDGV